MPYSIVNFSEVKSHRDKRLDAEHYHPWHLENLRKIKEKAQPLSEFIIHISGGATPLGAVYPEEGIPFLRVQNIMPNYISDSGIKHLSPSQNQEILRSQLKKDDVLLTITGAYGKSTVVTDEFVDANINQHSVKMTVRNVVPYFLSTFLNCKYGFSQSTRHVVGITRPALDYSAIKSFLIPDLNRKFQETIASYCSQAEISRADSKLLYSEAQNLLLAELGLAYWQPKHQLTFVKNFSDTQHAERIDADYFQPKYDEIINAIKSYSGGWDTLGNQCSTKRGSLIKDSFYDEKEGKPYIRGGDFSGGLLSDAKLVYINSEFSHTNEIQVYENNIVFSLIGSVGESALVTKEFTGSYISNNTGKIQCKSPNFSVTLHVLLVSIIGKLYFEKYKTQTAQPKISDKDLHNFVIPILTDKKQTEIEQKVLESFNLRKRAKHLLEHAKRAVEIAIEQNEQTAIDWLESVSQLP